MTIRVAKTYVLTAVGVAAVMLVLQAALGTVSADSSSRVMGLPLDLSSEPTRALTTGAGSQDASPDQAYPESRALDDSVTWIAKVRLGNMRHESRRSGSGYEDHTARSFTLYSDTYEYVSLHPWYEPNSELAAYWMVWIDLNQDGDFDDTVEGVDELVYANPSHHNGSTVKGMHQAYFHVPSGYDDLTTRMRVSMRHKHDDSTPSPGPDESFEYGEVEDYAVRIVAAPEAPAHPPTNVIVDDITATYARVSWEPVLRARSYEVLYRIHYRAEWIKLDTFFHSPDSTGSSIYLRTLAAETEYVVRVRAVNLGGDSGLSDEIRLTTAPSASSRSDRFPTVSVDARGAPFYLSYPKEWRLWDPYVIYDEVDGRYKVWYTVWGGHEYDFYQNRLMGVGYAWSDDGISWVRQPGGHIMLPEPGSWEQDGLETVSVLKKDGVYYMWYLGKRYQPYKLQLGLATSTDGVSWTKHPGNPVLSPEQPFEGDTVKEPSVLWDEDEGLFKMWYNGMRDRVVKVGHATSPDGVNWTKLDGPVNGDESAGWNHVHVAEAPGGGYQLYFLAGYSVYQAWSEDGITGWQMNPNGPVLRSRPVVDTWNGAKHDFENLLAYGSPSAVYRNGELKLYHMRTWDYASEYGDNSMRFGLATGRAPETEAHEVFVPLAIGGVR